MAGLVPDVVPATSDRQERLTGILLMCLAIVCFTLLDTTAKWLGGRLDTIQVVWTRFAGHFLLSLLFVRPWSRARALRTRRHRFLERCWSLALRDSHTPNLSWKPGVRSRSCLLTRARWLPIRRSHPRFRSIMNDDEESIALR